MTIVKSHGKKMSKALRKIAVLRKENIYSVVICRLTKKPIM